MIKADALDPADLVLFFTDGEPTAWDINGNFCGNGATTQTPEIVNPVKLANKFKGEGTHMFMLGVGGGIDVPNLQAMSGYVEYEAGVNTIGTADYSIGSFGQLAEDLEAFVDELCTTPLEITKEIVGPSCDSTVQFRFVIYNPGTESAATVVQVIDTFPAGYANITKVFPTGPAKLCIGSQCDAQGFPQPPNAFLWTTSSLPPGERDTLILSVDLLPNGPYDNIAWAEGFNTDLVSDSVINPVFVIDQAPVITCPPNVAIQCDDPIAPAFTGEATATDDNEEDPPVITYEDMTLEGACGVEYTIERTWTVTDACEKTDVCVQLIDIVDTTAPDLNCPPDVTIGCGGDTDPAATGLATAVDACDGPIVPEYSDMTLPGDCPAEMTILRTWSATDACGNEGTCAQLITIADTEAPLMTCPPDVTIACDDDTLPISTGEATGSDNCLATVDVNYTDEIAATTCPQAYTIIRTWSAGDGCGNISTCQQSITVADVLPPDITCPVDVTIACTASTMPASTGMPTTSDFCDGDPAVSHSDEILPGACPQAYTILRSWTATDSCGNSATCLQTITVEDMLAPVVDCPADVTIECDANTDPDATGWVSATENCADTLDISYADQIYPSGDPGANPLPAPAMRWVFLENGAMHGTCSSGTDCDSDVLCFGLEYTPGVDGTVSSYTTGFILDCVGGNSPIFSNTSCVMADASVATSCSSGGILLMNASGNSGNLTITADVPVMLHQVCLTLPVGSSTHFEEDQFTNLSVSIDQAGGGPITELPAYTTYLADRDILCNGIPACPQNYTILRTFTVVDACGNSSSCTQTIVVTDTEAPAITCPADLTLECTEDVTPDSTGFASATDNCDASPVVTYSDVTTAGDCAPAYTITRTWTATDTCGNMSSCLQVITIVDTTAPELTCPADLTITCLDDSSPVATGEATATDNCDPEPAVDYDDVIVDAPDDPGYLIERTWTATDACGNSATCLQLIRVDNPLMPVLIGDPLDTICSGDVVMFEADDPGIPGMTWSWVFGSGSSPGMAVNTGPHDVTYTHNAQNGSDGAFILLTVGAPGCEEVTDTVANVIVNDLPVAGIITPSGSPCVFGPKMFEASTPENPGYTYLWDFGAGAVPATADTYGPHTVEYSSAGSKTVQLVILNNAPGAVCSDTATTTFTVNACNGGITGIVRLVDGTPLGGVNVRLFADANLDGLPDDNIPIRNVNTLSSGTFAMASLLPAHYVLVQTQPAGYFSVLDEDTSEDFDSLANLNPNDNIIPVTIEPSEIDANNTFVEAVSPGIISGYVFDDADNNQTPAPAEGIADVTIELYTDIDQDGLPDNGGLVATTTTSTLGYYTFGDVDLGDYVIKELPPAGFTNVLDIDITNDGDIVPNTNMMDDLIPVTIIVAEHDAGNYFIEQSPCSQVVTNLVDGDPGSLRYMIDCADDGDTISFHANLQGETIILDLGRIMFDKTLYLHSDITPRLVIQSNVNGAFQVMSGQVVEFKNLKIISGLAGFPGAAFENLGELRLWDVDVAPNELLTPGNYLIFNAPPGELIIKETLQILADE